MHLQFVIQRFLVVLVCSLISAHSFVRVPFSKVFPKVKTRSFSVHSPDLNTNFEYLLRQRYPASSISFIDPDICTSPSRPWKTKIGFDVHDPKDNNSPPLLEGLRIPIYPISAVHLPSDALHILNNIQHKNIEMAHHLRQGMWKVLGNEGNFFVNTLQAADTKRIASIGTLMEVIEMEEVSNSDGEIIRIRLSCKARGFVKILGIEKQNDYEYMVGRVEILESYGFLPEKSDNSNEDVKKLFKSSLLDILDSDVEKIVHDYHTVRSLYIDLDGVASRELPPFARDHVQSHLLAFALEDFLDPNLFWNVADCWQMLCNTIREARRCDLQSDINEVMIESEMKKGGMLKLPIKRDTLAPEVQMTLNKMEQEACEEFRSLGMDPCLNFQILVGMCEEISSPKEYDLMQCHKQRLLYLGRLIEREKERIQTKGMLKVLFENTDPMLVGTRKDSTDDMNGLHFS